MVYCLIAFGISIVNAQNSSNAASLRGTVRDATGAAVPGAKITIRQPATNQTRQTVSGADGLYVFDTVPVGEYEVRAKAPGFAAYLNPSVALALGRTTELDLNLNLSGVNETVTVSDRAAVIDRTATSVTTSIDPERIAELPVNSRNYLEFTLLAPAVAPSSTAAGGSSGNYTGAPRADSGFTFGGLRARSNMISIDGLDNTDEATGAARVALSPEMAREFQIVNNGQSAEFGGVGGGAINVVTRTGSNDFHGGLFLFYQPRIFVAHDPLFESVNGNSKQKYRRYQPGGSIGGPIIRDRLFFYTAFEQEHLSTEEQSEIAAPVRTSINSRLASGFALNLTVRGLSSQFFPVATDETEASGKLTYLPNAVHTINVGFNFTRLSENADAFNADALTDETARGSSHIKDYQLTGSIVSILTPHSINDFRFQASGHNFDSHAGDQIGPGIEIIGAARFGRPFDSETDRRETRLQIIDNISFVQPHTDWKTGITVNHVGLRADSRDGFGALFVFRSLNDFLNGRPAEWRQAFGDPRTHFGITYIGAFVQNQYRAGNQLTFNLGARVDTTRLPASFRNHVNVSPRLGIAYSPDQKWVVRAGFGLFFDRLPLIYLNEAIQKDGTAAFEQVASDELAASIFATTSGGRSSIPVAGIARSIYRPDPRFLTPYSLQANAGIERQLAKETTLRADYLFTRGIHLPRTRNINLLPPQILTNANALSLGITNSTPQQIGRLVFGPGRVDPRFDNIYQLENTASSTYHGVSVTLNERFSPDAVLLVAYTASRTTDDASDFDEQPANPYDLRAERSLARQHLGQRLAISGLFELFGDEEDKGKKEDKIIGALLKNFEIAPIITINSSRPLNALAGPNDSRGNAYPFADRPLGVTRNSLRLPATWNADLRLVKYFPFTKPQRLDVVVEAFNLFNHPQAITVNQFYGSSNSPIVGFGSPIAFASQRKIRLSLDYEF